MTEPVPAFPLAWPIGRPRARQQERSRFEVSLGSAIAELRDEVRRMGGRSLVISSNLRVRQDDIPYASQRQPDDCGVAVYFTMPGRGGKLRPMCFACDRWHKVEHNMRAISKTIEALRGIERWGSGDMLEQAFMGFVALPAPAGSGWWEVLGVSQNATADEITEAYRRKAMAAHPDRGGSHDEMSRLNEARDVGLEAKRA